jgi:peptidoglycan-N-acetylglucosamine deacetylase
MATAHPTTRRSLLAATFLAPFASIAQTPPAGAPFRWPHGKRAALSLSFDDARASQLDTGIPLLNRLGVRATFYLVPDTAAKRAGDWKKAAAAGHEIGNHSRTHACTGNYRFARQKALEEFSLSRMEADLDGASADLERMLDVKTISFAYPCGQTFVGAGTEAASYIPLVARRFLAGRGYLSEAANDPTICDLANLMGVGCDDLDFPALKKLLDTAAAENRWLILAGHDIGPRAFQTTDTKALEELCRYATGPQQGIWLDTVGAIARHVQSARKAASRPGA